MRVLRLRPSTAALLAVLVFAGLSTVAASADPSPSGHQERPGERYRPVPSPVDIPEPPDEIEPVDTVPLRAAASHGVFAAPHVDAPEGSGFPSLLTTSSARIEDRIVERAPEPVGLEIVRLGVDAPVLAAGIAADRGMEVPSGVDEVAWYEFGPSPGEDGSAVLAAHVDIAGLGPGVFFELDSLEPGDIVVVGFDDGSARSFEVFEATRYLKEHLDTTRIFDRTGEPTLTLVTCGGAFNPSLRRYDSNVVVYARPVVEEVIGS